MIFSIPNAWYSSIYCSMLFTRIAKIRSRSYLHFFDLGRTCSEDAPKQPPQEGKVCYFPGEVQTFFTKVCSSRRDPSDWGGKGKDVIGQVKYPFGKGGANTAFGGTGENLNGLIRQYFSIRRTPLDWHNLNLPAP